MLSYHRRFCSGLLWVTSSKHRELSRLIDVASDKACLVWGRTCTGNGNCWLYNGEILRYTVNFTAAAFVTIGTLFDAGVWYFVKDLQIFDDELEFELNDY